MTRPILIASISSVALLTACGDGSSFRDDDTVAVGSAVLSGDTYTVSQNDVEVALNADDSFTIGGQRVWLNTPDRAQAFESENVLAIGGIAEDGTPFAGISGTAADAPTGDAIFEGGYGVLSGEDGYDSGALTLAYTFDAGTLTTTTGALNVDATVTQTGINGAVVFGEETGTLVGNFYGEGELAGAFTGPAIGGVIYGTQQ